MPFIMSKVSVPISLEQEKQLKTHLGKAIELVPGLNERHCGYRDLTAAIAKIFNEVLNIRPDHIYVKYEDIADWGVNGINFDRNDYQ